MLAATGQSAVTVHLPKGAGDLLQQIQATHPDIAGYWQQLVHTETARIEVLKRREPLPPQHPNCKSIIILDDLIDNP